MTGQMGKPEARPTGERAQPRLRRIGFGVSPDMSLSSMLLACEPLRSVNRFFQQPAYEIVFVAASRDPVISGIGIAIEPATTFGDDDEFDMIVVVSANDQPDQYKKPLSRWLRRQARRGVDLCAIDFGVALMAEAGLLDGYRVTLHWEGIAAMADRFPDVDFCDDVYVIDRKAFTCGGHMACNDLFLAIVERDQGTKIARFVAADIISGAPRPADTRQITPLSWDPAIRNLHLRHTVDLMEENIETPLSIPEIAREINLSVRQLQLLSKRHFNETLSNRYLDIRLNAARNMLMYGDMSITEIVAATGFNSASTFSRAFRNRFETTARAYRKAFTSKLARPYFVTGG
jgi:AraC family carnitine catabolism transcriptional activator